MKATIHNLTDEITTALGPIFRKNPDYSTIFSSMCLVMARVVQSTPDKGEELLVMEDAYNEIKHALKEFIKLEKEYEAIKEAKKAKLDEGIASFDGFARPEQPIEPGSAGDYPDNPNQNIAKTVTHSEIKEAMAKEEQAYNELTALPEGVQAPEGLFSTGPIFKDNDGVFVEPPKDEAGQAKEAPQEGSGQ